VYQGHVEVAQAIVHSEHCNSETLNQHNNIGDTALILAAKKGHTEVAQAILSSEHCNSETLNQHNGNGGTALILAAKNGHTEVVQAIVSSKHYTKEMINQKNSDGNALKYASELLLFNKEIYLQAAQMPSSASDYKNNGDLPANNNENDSYTP